MSDTMAEAFCEEHLMTWTEHGEDFTDWRDGDTQANLDRMRQAGALTLFEPMEKQDCFMIVTVFPDRSWIVQEEPTGGAPPMVGTGDDPQAGRRPWSEPETTNTASRTSSTFWTSSTKRWRPSRNASRNPSRNASRRNYPRIWTPRETNTPSSESRCPAAGFRAAVSGRPLPAGDEVQPQPKTPTRKEPEMSNTTPETMAEAFCNEHLTGWTTHREKHTGWTKHGEKHTGWEDKDIYTNMRGITQTGGVTMFQARAITLFHAVQKNGYHMTITMFRDRSWMVHESPTSGEMVMVGTKENEHQILDLIHEELNTSLEGLAQEFEVDVAHVLAQAKDISEPEPQPKREPPEFPAHPDAPREQ